jgi:cupin 2 domain-containing protein
MNAVQNIFADIPSTLPQELIQTLAESANVRIERIVSQGHATPEGFWYDQDQAEFVVLLRGVACLQLEGENPVEMKPGDCINIPAHRRHRVEWTTLDEATIWVVVHYGDPTLRDQQS